MPRYWIFLKWSPVIVVAFAWGLFVSSFFLPATTILSASGTWPGTPLTGWQAFTASIFIGAMNPLMWIIEPRVLIYLVFPFANLFMLFVPKIVFDSPEWAGRLAAILIALAAVPWLSPKLITGELFIGFYCWNCSYLLMALGFLIVPWHYSCESRARA